jgi:hypothetical protein
MVELYFNGISSSLEVNIDGKTLREFHERIKEPLDSNLFSVVEFKVLENLSDTYSRMIISSDYLNFRKTEEYFGTLYENSSLKELFAKK